MLVFIRCQQLAVNSELLTKPNQVECFKVATITLFPSRVAMFSCPINMKFEYPLQFGPRPDGELFIIGSLFPAIICSVYVNGWGQNEISGWIGEQLGVEPRNKIEGCNLFNTAR